MTRVAMVAAALLTACGGSGTEAGTRILAADVEDTDVPPEVLRTLVGVIASEHEVQFPDGEGKVRVRVRNGRAADTSQGDVRVPGPEATLYLRSINVEVVDAGGYEMSATLLGNPTNAGTVERPVHTRMVQVSR